MHRALSASPPVESATTVFPAGVWLGAMVPKRWAKRAVTRNTLKRQIYIVSASLDHQFACAAYLIRLRAEFSRQLFPSATSDALKQAAQAELTDLLQTGLKAK